MPVETICMYFIWICGMEIGTIFGFMPSAKSCGNKYPEPLQKAVQFQFVSLLCAKHISTMRQRGNTPFRREVPASALCLRAHFLKQPFETIK
ncbi:hypothetical protein CGZ60_03860 [Neisseria animalis]|nr:hypothetical protein CGZ60_03860 [Neisseria animalis]